MGCGASASPANNQIRELDAQNSNMQNHATLGSASSLPSQPVVLPGPFRLGSPVNTAQLKQMRDEFWSTRVGGSPLMWQALRSSSEAMLAGDAALANAILEASGVSTPYGNLDLCYDERGYLYKVPPYCVGNPEDVIEGGSSETFSTISQKSFFPFGGAKVPVVKPEGRPLKLRIKVYPGDKAMTVNATTSDNIAELKALVEVRATEIENMPVVDASRQRLIFLGKELKDAQLLGDIGLDDSRVLQIFLKPPK